MSLTHKEYAKGEARGVVAHLIDCRVKLHAAITDMRVACREHGWDDGDALDNLIIILDYIDREIAKRATRNRQSP